jgi:hypothetical protein
LETTTINTGLYLVKRPKRSGFGEHWGVIDIGNRVPLNHRYVSSPRVIHQTREGILAESIPEMREWMFVGVIEDEAGAIQRIQQALKTPNYDVFGNNCEHFSSFVATGKKESKQVFFVIIMLGIAVFVSLAKF